MRKFAMLSVALGALAIPAYAQAADQEQGSASGKIMLLYTGEVLPGKADQFKQVAQKLIATVKQEPGTLAYVWSMRPDGKTFDSMELYGDSAAVTAHVKDVLSKYGKDLGQLQKEVVFLVYGSPDAQAKKALAPLNPVYTTEIAGFIR